MPAALPRARVTTTSRRVLPPTGDAPPRESYLGDMPAQHLEPDLEGDHQGPVEDIGSLHVDEDATEDVLVPAVSTANGATAEADHFATRVSNPTDVCWHEPPTIPSREKDLDDMPAQHLEGNAQGLVEDISLPPLGEDSAQNVPGPSRLAESVRPADRPSTSKSSAGYSAQAPPTGCADNQPLSS